MSDSISGEQVGDLMLGGAGALLHLEREVEAKDELAKRLLDQCRYQHRVLSEIYGLSHAGKYAYASDVLVINAKALAAIRAAEKSGLLA